MAERRIRVAISGGGMAGATLMHALLKHDHIDAHIFESASEFREAGMAVGMTRNAFQSLELIGPSAREALEKAGSVPHHGVRFMLALGPDAGKMVDEIDARKDGKRLTSIVHRAALLKELLAEVPIERMHASKKLKGVDRQSDKTLTLQFEDGSTHETDVLIGADGIHSAVRKVILGEDDPASSPVSAGMLAIPTLQPYEKLRSILGDEYVDTGDPREWAWFGKGTFMMHNVLNAGELIQFIATVKTDTGDAWMKEVPADEFKGHFVGWPPHLQTALSAVVGDEASLKCWCTWEHAHARTYVDGPIAVMGDAAHATTPWQASGGGMSIEDALVLSSLLGHIRSPEQAPVALQVYDEARRQRTQDIVESSRNTGLIFTGKNPEYPMDYAGLKGRLPPRWDFILDFDNGKARDEAVQRLETLLQ
ncbi:Putative FAD-binding domain, FAD/NAD(P)-binding domain superfamily [Septoria linicola]|uniref:FAD-binding domain, FAD/NAD(P)-binding domain superfamily n=1 Tax=Septoria linicola TaxID=215465 RepID=A0A9Q9AVK9_9PEZI|nr:Putative FAD-binding domain, FAD/NAD(P)-binding domain superfamily [Septoria linicola]